MSLQHVVGGILLFLIGLALAIKPEIVWNLTEKWKTTGEGSATPTYITLSRIIGSLLMIAGVLVAVWGH